MAKKEKTLNDALIAALKATAEEFKPTFPIEKAGAEKTPSTTKGPGK